MTEARKSFTRLVALPITGGPARDVDAGDAVLSAFTLNRSRTMTAFVRERLTQAPEVHVTRLDAFRPLQVSHANSSLPVIPLPRTQLVQWTSRDGAEIEGLLTYPVGYEGGRRYPLILAVHTGGHGFQQTFVASPFGADYYPVTELALRGFAVFRCNVRGGVLQGYGPEYAVPFFKVKEKAEQDVLTGADHVIKIGIADASRLGIAGFSNGGLVTSWVITQTPRFKAAIIRAGFPDLIADAAGEAGKAFHLGAAPWQDLRPYIEYSPMLRVGAITTPTLILHGEHDEAVAVSQGLGLYRVLKRRGVPSEMVVYPREGHTIDAPKFLADMGSRQVAWLEKFLRGSNQDTAR